MNRLGLIGALTVLAFNAVTTALATDRATALARMESVMGPFPKRARTSLHPIVLSETRTNGLILRDITYESEPGSRVPAFLLMPEAALTATNHTFPAVLALHQTHAAGRKVVVGLRQSPDDEYGVELARRGWVVLAPAYPLLADYAPDVRGLGYASGTMKAIWDNSRGLDLLASMPSVDGRRLVAIGHSLGGHNALFTAAFDPRIQAVAVSCAFDSFRDYYGGKPEVWREERGWCQLRYMPRLAAYQGRLGELPFDFQEVLAAIAPRPIFINAPRGDSNFRWESVDRIVNEVRPLWSRVPNALVVEHPDGPHRFPPEQRNTAYSILSRAGIGR